MIEIANEVRRKKYNFQFLLAGDGPERANLESLVNRYGLNKLFRFKGHVDNIDELYKNLNLYLCTSIHEGIPMSILEAMSHGLPVVAPKVGGITEILIDGVNGYLVVGRQPHLFAEKCIKLYNDTKLYNHFSMNAVERIKENFSAEVMARKYHDLYMDLID
jgi:glycosyltransferase involved in cell wall biosynthesis